MMFGDLNLSTAKLKWRMILGQLAFAAFFGFFVLPLPMLVYAWWRYDRRIDTGVLALLLLEIIAISAMVYFIIRALKVPGQLRDMQAELAYHYPELEDNLSGLNDAVYFNKKIRVLVYGHHLINYRNRQMIDLEECVYISYVAMSVRRGSGGYFISSKAIDGSIHEIEGRTPWFVNPTEPCQELIAFIDEHFDAEVAFR